MRSEAEFDRLLSHIADEAETALEYWRLRQGIEAAAVDYHREFASTPAFWNLTPTALIDAVVLHLGRLYDKTSGALSLGSLLLTIKARVDYFAARQVILDQSVLDAEILEAMSAPAVRKLVEIRNKFVAHRDAERVRLGPLSSRLGLSEGEIEGLLQRAFELTKKYRELYSGVRHRDIVSLKSVGDFEVLLRALKAQLDHDAKG